MVLRRSAGAKRLARTAGWWYVANIVTGATAAVWSMRKLQAAASIANLLATIAYIAVTVLLFRLFRPVSKPVSLVAALFSLIGCMASLLDMFGQLPKSISPLMFFGAYCLLIGYLILRSWFLPKILGVLLAIGGLGWLTFALPSLSRQLFPYNMAPGIISESLFALWLVAPGLNEARWQDQAEAAEASTILA
jgi:hypothetical protein